MNEYRSGGERPTSDHHVPKWLRPGNATNCLSFLHAIGNLRLTCYRKADCPTPMTWDMRDPPMFVSRSGEVNEFDERIAEDLLGYLRDDMEILKRRLPRLLKLRGLPPLEESYFTLPSVPAPDGWRRAVTNVTKQLRDILQHGTGLLQTSVWYWRNRGFGVKSVGFSMAQGDQGGSSHARDRGLSSRGSRSDA